MVDRLARVPDLEQLIAGYDSVLIFGQRPRLPRHPNPFAPSIIRQLVT
jgi:hypothetical protein